jgi:hypothetical protein
MNGRCPLCEKPVTGWEMPLYQLPPEVAGQGFYRQMVPNPPPILEPCGHQAYAILWPSSPAFPQENA